MPKTSILLQKTLELLRHRDRTQTYEIIARDTGLTISFLVSLSGDRCPKHASVSRIEALYEYLAKKSLEI